MIDEEVLKKIIDVLKTSNKDLTIKEIAEKTGLARVTVRTYLVHLLATNKVEITRTIGKAKFFRLKEP